MTIPAKSKMLGIRFVLWEHDKDNWYACVLLLMTCVYPPPHMACMYPPPHMACMYPPPHMACMYPHITCIYPPPRGGNTALTRNTALTTGMLRQLLGAHVLQMCCKCVATLCCECGNLYVATF